MAKQDFEILGGLKIGSVLAFDSLAQIQHTSVGLAEVAKQGTLASLTDVNLNGGISNGQVLKWDGSQFAPANDSDTFLTGITSPTNTALGVDAFSTGGGTDNVAIGHSALKVSTGSSNIAIGDDAGSALISGDQNLIIGRIDGSTIEGKSGQMIMADGAGTLIMSADSAQKVSMVGDVDVATVLTFDSTTETTDKISEGSINFYWTETRFDTSFGAKSTDDLQEGDSDFYYTETRFDTSLAGKTTNDLSQGDSNEYYTDAKVNANFALRTTDSLSEGLNPLRYYWTETRFDTSFDAKTTNDLSQGDSNEYYTDAKVNANFALRTTDSLSEGLNPLRYYWTETRFDTSFGAKTTNDLQEGDSDFYYTETRFDTSLAGKTTNDLNEGDSNFYWTETRFDTSLAGKTTNDLTEGDSNLYYTEDRWLASFRAANTDSLSEGLTRLYYTDARAQAAARSQSIQAGTGVSYDSLTGTISIGQDVDSDADVVFGSVNIDGVVVMDTQETAASAQAEVISSINATDFRSMRVTIQASYGGDFHTSEMLVLHDGSNVLTTEFGAIKTSGNALATFSAAITGGNVEITATPVGSIDPAYKIVRHSTKA